MSNDFDVEYKEILAKCEPHFEKVKSIVESFRVLPEGSCYYHHMSFHPDLGKVNQRKNLISLAKKSNTIIEIGFNMGHSALFCLYANPNCVIYSYDNCQAPYTEKCIEYVSAQFPDRIKFTKGNTRQTLQTYSGPVPDLIHIDGSKTPEIQDSDFASSLPFSKINHTVFIFNDSWMSHVKKAVKYLEISGTIKPFTIHECGTHVLAHYVKRPRLPIAICTLSIGERYKEIVKYSNQVKRDYCTKNVYDYRDDEDDGIVDKTRPFAWSKINLINRCLEEGYEYVVWIDADAYIMNPEIRVESIILNFSRGKDILLCMDIVDIMNSGVMFIKNTEWSRAFFKQVYTMTDYINHPNWEQGAIINMYEGNSMKAQEHMVVLPKTYQRLFNSYYLNYKNEDFILHLAGCWKDNSDTGLSHIMKDFCPIRMDHDTDESYEKRMEVLKSK